ncbi:MAG: hypothetical protein Q9162_005762 [Coniocarpon cinnabarinum]
MARFLLPRLHLNSINQMDNAQDIEDALDSLPETYEQTYDEALQRIKDSEPFRSKRAFQIFSWLSFAFEPLSVEAMRHALAISPNRKQYLARALPDPEDMLSVCSGLVIIDDELMTVRLVHYTIQEYFREKSGVLFPRGEQQIALDCLRYLSYSDFVNPCANDDQLSQRKQQYHLLPYAAKYWSRHVHRSLAQTDLLQDIVAHLYNPTRFTAEQIWQRERTDCYAGIWQMTPFRDPSRGSLRRDSPLHTACAHDLHHVVKHLLVHDRQELEAFNSFGETPLHRAADTGSAHALQELLSSGADVSKPLQRPVARLYQPAAIHLAANGGHAACVRALGADGTLDIDTRCGGSRYTPLHLASATNTEAVEELLKRGANSQSWAPGSPHYIERGPFTPLHFVILWMMGVDIVRRAELLIESGCDINIPTGLGNTPLHLAVAREKRLTRFFLSKGADLHAQNKAGQTPLKLACDRARVDWLVDDELTAIVQPISGVTPLHVAIWKGDLQQALFLVREGASITAVDGFHKSSIEYTISAGNVEVLQEMLKMADASSIAPVVGGRVFDNLAWASADYEPRESQEWVALVTILRLLVPLRQLHNNDFSFVQARTKIGGYNKTLLIHAAEMGHLHMAEFLLDFGADVNAKDVFGSTAGSYARENVSMLRLLLRRGFDLNMKHGSGRTLPEIVNDQGTSASRAFIAQCVVKVRDVDEVGEALYSFSESSVSSSTTAKVHDQERTQHSQH